MRPDRGGSFIDALTFCLVVVLALSVVLTPAWAEEAERYNSEGVGHFNKGDYDAALASFKEAIRLNPDIFFAHYNLGMTYGKKGQWDASIDSFKEANRLKPDDARAHFNLGVVYVKKGQWDASIDSFKEVIRLKPDVAVAHYRLGNAYVGKGDRKAALVEYEWLKTRNPGLVEELLAKIPPK